ncbi:hypothetical protein L6452_11123 [Arctium lappa]|uniref:Uncharacterized protein n=1 Tax=Arctium lappa TaxID=4217 RepID=A0ACB9DPH4_ARCLA|nr:hypothetical protein L6452_11123 [Arctium lappa]
MNYSLDFPSVDSDHMSKRTGSMGITDEVNLSVNVFPVSFTGHVCHCQAFSAPDDLPKTVAPKIPSITSLINKGVDDMEAELDHLGRPIAVDAEAQMYTILELCRAFDKIFKEHLDICVKSSVRS